MQNTKGSKGDPLCPHKQEVRASFLAQKLKITKRTHFEPRARERKNLNIDSKTGFLSKVQVYSIHNGAIGQGLYTN